jgi:hypothetical protein
VDNLSDSAPAPSVPESYIRKTDWRAPSFSTRLAGRLSGCERQKEVVGARKRCHPEELGPQRLKPASFLTLWHG